MILDRFISGPSFIDKEEEQQSEYMTANDFIALLPANVQRFLSECNTSFITDEEKIKEEFDKRKLTDTDSYLVVQVGMSSLKIRRAEIYVRSAENVLHEIGHMLDFYDGNMKYWSSTKIFGQVYENEKAQSGYSEYCNSNPYEYFAESFLTYILHPEEMERTRPVTFRYVKNIADKV